MEEIKIQKKRMLSGIKPSGYLTLGSYLGAVKNWSELAEDRSLKCAHAGIMPLPKTPFALGKSAYKLIRYQQYALPAVASPVGENCHVLHHAHTGFLADGDDEWVEAIIRLSDAGCRENMVPAITAAAEKYRLENIAAELDAFLTETLFNK